MSPPPQQAGPIAVYGATGYTGRLVAGELVRRGADFVLAARNAAKLQIVAEDVGADVPLRAVALDDAAGLRELLEPCAAVIACAGPFRLHGDPVLEAAIETGTHYLDTTGEQPFIRTVFEQHGGRAQDAGVALITAMGFDYAPGDMIAALTAEGMEPLDQVTLAYAVRGFAVSRGTALSGLGMIAGGDVEWRQGELVPASRAGGRGSFDFPEPIGRQRMVHYPSGEQITVPRHLRTGEVRTMLTAATVVPYARLALAAGPAMAAVGLLARTPVRRLAEMVIPRLPEGPSIARRRRARFLIVCEARAGRRRRRGLVRGSDVYGLTARTTVEGALQCAAPGFDREGALAPSQAFDPREFLRSLSSFGVEHEIVPARPE